MIHRWIIRILLIGGGAYIGAALLLWANRHALIYPFDTAPATPAGAGVSAEVAMLPVPGAAALPVWIRRPDAGRPVILFFMGNGGSLRFFAPRLKGFAARGYGYAAMPYRGGGGVPGDPDEATLKRDAAALYEGLSALLGEDFAAQRRVAYGVSLGSGLAAWLGAERGFGGIVLEAPYTRLCDAAEDAYPVFPACLILRDERYDTIGLIDRIDAPVLILHGDQDGVIPVHHGRALKQAAPDTIELKIFPGGRHNDLRAFGQEEETEAFLRRHGLHGD